MLTPYYSQTSTARLRVRHSVLLEHRARAVDATLTPVFMARRGLQLKNQCRYLERPYTGELQLRVPAERQGSSAPREGGLCLAAHADLPRPAPSAASTTTGVRRPLLRRPGEPGEAGLGRQPAAGRLCHARPAIARLGAIFNAPGARAALPDAAGSARADRAAVRTACRSSIAAAAYNDIGGVSRYVLPARIRALHASDR